MLTGFLHLHSFLRWVLLVLLIVTIADSLVRMYKPMDERERKLALFTMIVMHTQLLIGFALYFMSPMIKGMMAAGKVMNKFDTSFWVVYHMAGMLLAATFITLGYRRAKNQERGWAKHRLIFFYYLIALIVILVSIPWPFREEIGAGRGWF